MIAVVLLSNSQAFAQVLPFSQPNVPGEGGILEPFTHLDSISQSGMVTDGRYVYLVDYPEEVIILDTINPARPVKIGSIPIDIDDYLLAVTEGILYMGKRGEGILIYDVSEPANPGLVGLFNPIENMYMPGMAISGSFAYLADYFLGLTILNISDPAHPSVLGVNIEEGIEELVVQGQTAYGRSIDDNMLIIYDVTNPAQPTVLSRYYNSRYWFGYAINGDYVYLSGESGDPDSKEYYIDVIDVSNPSEPEWVTDLPELATSNWGLTVKDGLLYVARWDGLAIYTTTDPTDPQLTGKFPSYYVFYMAPQGDQAFFGDANTIFHILDTTDPALPVQTGFYTWPQSADYLTSEGNYLYSAQNNISSLPSSLRFNHHSESDRHDRHLRRAGHRVHLSGRRHTRQAVRRWVFRLCPDGRGRGNHRRFRPG